MNFTILAPFHYKKNSINTHLNFPNSFYFHLCHFQHLLFLLLSSLPPLFPFFRNWRGHNMQFFISFVFKMCAWCSPFFLPIYCFFFMKHAFHSLEELHKCGRQMKTTCSFQQPFFGEVASLVICCKINSGKITSHKKFNIHVVTIIKNLWSILQRIFHGAKEL